MNIAAIWLLGRIGANTFTTSQGQLITRDEASWSRGSSGFAGTQAIEGTHRLGDLQRTRRSLSELSPKVRMRASSVSRALLILGVLVGGAAGVALALGLRLDQLPPWMITVGMYKLAFIAAGGLFVAGALLGRAARAPSRRLTSADETPRGLHAGEWADGDSVPRQPDPVNRDRRDDRLAR